MLIPGQDSTGSNKDQLTNMSSSPPPTAAIHPRRFYKSSNLPAKYVNIELPKSPYDVVKPSWLRSITEGPTDLWKVFKKQADALKFSRDHGEGLMTFAFQEGDGSRLFLSAHPVSFWFCDNSQKRPEDRRTYEVIAENAVCKLYFDLEFDKEFNHEHNGVQMTESFIKIVSFFLKEEFGVSCDRTHVLDLDSTTNSKFSRHLIYQLPKTYFRDNYNAGNFVKMICDKLSLLIHSQSSLEDFCLKSNVPQKDVEILFVTDKHGAKKIFCDVAVYSKNRHFRVYKSTKWRKNSPLLVSIENEYKPQIGKKQLPEQQLFLDSLITYLENQDQEISILEFGGCQQKIYMVKDKSKLPECPVISEGGKQSPQPVVDRFVESVVSPGLIRRSIYYSSLNKIIYDISGNRYCHNIGRQHKSNNIYYVVDMNSYIFYQKCHDPDCAGFHSAEKNLPPEIAFFLENEGDVVFDSVPLLTDTELQDVYEAMASVAALEQSQCLPEEDSEENHFPEFGLSDSEMLDSSTLMDNSIVM